MATIPKDKVIEQPAITFNAQWIKQLNITAMPDETWEGAVDAMPYDGKGNVTEKGQRTFRLRDLEALAKIAPKEIGAAVNAVLYAVGKLISIGDKLDIDFIDPDVVQKWKDGGLIE